MKLPLIVLQRVSIGSLSRGLGMRSARRLWGAVLGLAIGVQAADYTAPGLSTRVVDPSEVVVEGIRILSEQPWTTGQVLLEVGVDLRNLGDSMWEKPSVFVRDEVAGETIHWLPTASTYSGIVAPGEVILPEHALYTVVATATLADARAALLAGTPFNITSEKAGPLVAGSSTHLVMDAPQILTETALANGFHLLEIQAGIRNTSSESYSSLVATLASEDGTVLFRPPSSTGTNPAILAPSGTLSDFTSIILPVANDHLAAIREAILTGAGVGAAGNEMWVYAYPPQGFDEATALAWRWPAEWANAADQELRLVFTNTTPLLASWQPGDLLVENVSIHQLVHAGTNLTSLADYVPFLVSQVSSVSNEVHVVGQRKLLLEVVRSATLVGTPSDAYVNPVRDPYRPDPEKTHTRMEQSERSFEAMVIETQVSPRDGRLADLNGMFSRPWHFNELAISEHVRLSGELLFRQSGIQLEVKIKNFRIERVVANIEAGVVVNFLIECGEAEDTSNDPEDAKSKTLFNFNDLPLVTFNLGGVPVSVKPVVKLTAGVEANIPSRLTLPLQSAFTVGMEMGYDRSLINGTNDGYFSRPITEFIPVRVSDPTVFDELAATLGFWTQLDVGLEIGAGAGVILQAGPSLGVRLQNDYRLAPLADPWWEIDLGVDLIGNFAIDLELLEFAKIQLLDTSAELHHFDLFHWDAGGPLLGGQRMTAAAVGDGYKPRVGEEVRWGRVFQSRPNFQDFDTAFVFGVPGSDGEFIAGGANAHSILSRFSRTGELLWMKDTYPVPSIQRAVPVADGTLFTAGLQGLSVVFSQLDGDGNFLWNTSYNSSPLFALKAVTVRTNLAGQLEFFAAGSISHSTITHSDPALIKLDHQGKVVWAQSYPHPNDDETYAITGSADGNLLLAGFVHAPVTPPPIGVPVSGNILKLAVSGGLLMKIDAETGAVLWATVCPGGMVFTAVTEAPDGTIFAGGASSRTIREERPSNVFARFTRDGSLRDHIMVGTDPDWPQELTSGGRSPYDTVHSLTWTPEGLVACGQSGLGEEVTGWVMGLTEKLGVRFFSAVDGSGATPLMAIADVGDGLAVLGHTLSPYTLAGQGGQRIPLLLKLPWEGLMRFGTNTGLRSLYLQPWMYHSSATDEFQIQSYIVHPPTLMFPLGREEHFGNHHGPVTFAVEPLLLTTESLTPPLNTMTNYTVFPVEFRPPADLADYAAWEDYHGLPASSTPDGDTDGDGLPDAFEAYFGRDPKIADHEPIFTITLGGTDGMASAVIAFSRSSDAQSWGVEIQSSIDLQNWSSVPGVWEEVVAIDTYTERVTLTVPKAGETHRFFRATLPTSPLADVSRKNWR